MTSHPHSPVSALVARDVCKAYGDRIVLDGVDLTAQPGQPLGLVGENGVGKSTLMRLLAGVEPADSGSFRRPAELDYLGQEPDFGAAATVAEVLRDALAPLHDAVHRLETLATRLEDPQAADEYARLLEWVDFHDGWDADRRAEVAAARLGLSHLDRDCPVAALSGGQRSRLALAALITRRPECLLLDEPTNHLDDDAVAFLEEFLVSLPGIVVTASHDRTFLENVCGAVVDLDPSHFGVDGEGGNRFTGGYSAYLTAKREARGRWERAFEDQQDELDALRDTARTSARQVAHNRPARDNDKFIYHSKGQNVARTISRRVRDTERRIEVLERDRIPKPPKAMSFDGALAAHRSSSGMVVLVRDLVVPNRVDVPRLDLAAGDRLLVTGANGSGQVDAAQGDRGRAHAALGVGAGARTQGWAPAPGRGLQQSGPDPAPGLRSGHGVARPPGRPGPAAPPRAVAPDRITQRRPAAPARARDPRRASAGPAPPRRADQPHLADPGGGARGVPSGVPRHGARHHRTTAGSDDGGRAGRSRCRPHVAAVRMQ